MKMVLVTFEIRQSCGQTAGDALKTVLKPLTRKLVKNLVV
jgi:hypothetical protein